MIAAWPVSRFSLVCHPRKKKLDLPPEAKRELIEPGHPQLSIARQWDLIGLPRSTYYYQVQGESAEHLHVMHLLDRPYTATPS
jgi:hypothetical protein